MLHRRIRPRAVAAVALLGMVQAGCQTTGSPAARVGAPGEPLTAEQRANLDMAITNQIGICADPSAYTPTFVPTYKVEFNEDGHVIGNPEPLNYGKTPVEKAAAEGALRAIRRCDPLVVGGLYRPYFQYWRTRIFRFAYEKGQ